MNPFKPADTYELLLKQAWALANLVHCLEQQREISSKPRLEEFRSAKQVDSERAANERLTAELEAANEKVRALTRELAIERRPIRDMSPGPGPASRRVPPYLGLAPKYQHHGEMLIETLRAFPDATDDELHCYLGEPFAYLHHDNEKLRETIMRLDEAIADLPKYGVVLPMPALPRDHPLRESHRRHTTELARRVADTKVAAAKRAIGAKS